MKAGNFLGWLIVPLFSFAHYQSVPVDSGSSGIQFDEHLVWKQLVEKAEHENKFIFIDCYATWCVPCKKMEAEVFSKKDVGDFINAHFVSVRIQEDTTVRDDERTREWYFDAHKIINAYGVDAFPTFLFFTPDGKIIHRATGEIGDSSFLRLAADVINQDQEVYTGLRLYREGKLDYTKLPALAMLVKNNKDDSVANSIANDYLVNYLDKLDENRFCSAIDPGFARAFLYGLITSKDVVFDWLFHDGQRMDEAVHAKGFSKAVVNHVIDMEDVAPAFATASQGDRRQPNWKGLERDIKSKYGKTYAEEGLLNARLKWYKAKKDWSGITKYTIQKIERKGLDTSVLGWLYLNNTCYEIIFKHSSKKNELRKAAGWMEGIVKSRPDDYQDIDTYANLLYKEGKTSKGLAWEQKAVQLNLDASRKKGNAPDRELANTLQKMERGLPTW